MGARILDDWARMSPPSNTTLLGPEASRMSTPAGLSNVVIGRYLRGDPPTTTGSIEPDDPTGLSAPSIAASQNPKDAVVRLIGLRAAGFKFDVRQRWEGIVTSVDEEEFSVTLRDLTDPTSPECEAVLALEEVSPEDLPLLEPGAVLYWSIGYEQTTGTHKRVSLIRLRRLPAWSRRDMDRARQRAAALSRLLERDDDEQGTRRKRRAVG